MTALEDHVGRTGPEFYADVAKVVKRLARVFGYDAAAVGAVIGTRKATTYSRLGATTRFTPTELYRLACEWGVSVGIFYRTPDEVERLISEAMRDLGATS